MIACLGNNLKVTKIKAPLKIENLLLLENNLFQISKVFDTNIVNNVKLVLFEKNSIVNTTLNSVAYMYLFEVHWTLWSLFNGKWDMLHFAITKQQNETKLDNYKTIN